MDLWIRSQNREYIVKINSNIFLKYDDKKKIIANYIPDFSDKYDGSYDELGTYESKERALEVLDEIQKLLNTFDPKNMARMIVYEMPKE